MTANKSTSNNGKDTIYVDVDDEITHIIDKIKDSDKKIVALVLPKRATVLQSIVNMKLLKRAASNSKKNLVLITSEAGLMPLAGAAGIHVAKSLSSKPEIPGAPEKLDDKTDEISFDDPNGDNLDKAATVGALSAAALAANDNEPETIELDNMQMEDKPPGASAPKSKKPKKSKKLKVPSFDSFKKKWLIIALVAVALIGGWLLAFVILPKATISIKTDAQSAVSSFDFTAGIEITEADINDQKIPAVLKESKKTDTEKVPATGERDDGTKASGEVTISVSCTSGNSVTVPAGTAVSTGGLNYITQKSVTLNSYKPSPCSFTGDVDVTASQNGDKYNIGSGKSFSVAGFSSASASNSDAFTGGTSKIVKIVNQSDIDKATEAIKARQGTVVTDELKSLLENEGLFPLEPTQTGSDPKVTATPAVGGEASEVTVSSEVAYSMLGVHRNDLRALVEDDVKDEFDLNQQEILDDGIDTATIRLNNSRKPGEASISFRSNVTAGTKINEDEIKNNVKGKRRGEVEDYVGAIKGVQDVEVTYSPFWVMSTPKSTKKITIIVEKPESTDSPESSSSSNE